MQRTREERIMRMISRLDGMSKRLPKPTTAEEPDSPPPVPGPGMGRVMSILNDSGDMNQAQLAKELDIRPQSLSELLSKLEAEECVARRQSPSDKRQTIVSLTEKGKIRVAGFRERHRKDAEAFLAALTEEEKENLFEILKKLIDSHKTCCHAADVENNTKTE